MLFALKKLTGGLLMPLPLLLLTMAGGLLLLWFSRKQKAGRIILTISWLLLLLLSLQPVADRLLLPLEQRYPTWNGTSRIEYIVVLGGGYTWNPQWAPGSNLLNNSLPRVVEGVRQWRAQPQAKLIFTGAAASGNSLSSAEVAARVAISLGVPSSAIIRLDTPRDTAEEAQAVKKRIQQRPLLLVTSANHMPRAMALFHDQGLHPIAAPANQLAVVSPLNWWEKAIPDTLWLSHSERVSYEMLGDLWQWLQAQGASKPAHSPTTN